MEMPPQTARKPLDSYHHGDLRDALIKSALEEAELGGPEAVNISSLAKKLGVSQPAPYRHFADREALLTAVATEAFREFNGVLRDAIKKRSKRSKLSRIARATLDFGLRRNGIYRLIFASRWKADAPLDGELRRAALEAFDLVVAALDVPAVGFLRERHALTIWAGVHGVVMLAEQGLLTGKIAHTNIDGLVEDMVEQTELALSHAIKKAVEKRR
jgi:AcrR family transcriptional regulator